MARITGATTRRSSTATESVAAIDGCPPVRRRNQRWTGQTVTDMKSDQRRMVPNGARMAKAVASSAITSAPARPRSTSPRPAWGVREPSIDTPYPPVHHGSNGLVWFRHGRPPRQDRLPGASAHGSPHPWLRSPPVGGVGATGGLPLLHLRLLEPRGGRAGLLHRARQVAAGGGGERRPHLLAPLPSQRRDRRGPRRPAREGGRVGRGVQLRHGRHLDGLLHASASRDRASSTRCRSTAAPSTSSTSSSNPWA